MEFPLERVSGTDLMKRTAAMAVLLKIYWKDYAHLDDNLMLCGLKVNNACVLLLAAPSHFSCAIYAGAGEWFFLLGGPLDLADLPIMI
ncbi:hypothetical protein CsSME_00042478 [Camellia sinensis var. sinensis]